MITNVYWRLFKFEHMCKDYLRKLLCRIKFAPTHGLSDWAGIKLSFGNTKPADFSFWADKLL